MYYYIQDNTLTALGDAIRAKANMSNTMTPAGMIDAINGLEVGGATAPETVSVAITLKTFVGYFMYYDGTQWKSVYSGSTTKTITAVKNFPIFVCINKSSYSISSVRITSGTASTESAFMDDSNSACTYFTPSTDCAVTVQGTW